MKKVTYAFLTLLISLIGNAAILTVNNNNPSPGQYSDLQAAIDAASGGDTLLIHRSPTSYGNITITKKLILIGEGVLPNKVPLNSVIIGTLTLTYNPTTLKNATGSSIIGLSINTCNINESSSNVNRACDSISFCFNKINNLLVKNEIHGLNVYKNIIGGLSNGLLYKSYVNNNIISTVVCNSNFGNENIFINNVILQRINFGGGICANNIMYAFTGTFSQGSKNVIFSNNLIFNAGGTNVTQSEYTVNGNSSVNNLFDVNPSLINPQTFATLYAYTHTSPTSGPFADFHLQTGSPAIGAGTDGKDLGIYGGSTPWRDGSITDSRYRYYPLPDAVPVIIGITVQNPVVNEGGNLQIQLNATTAP